MRNWLLGFLLVGLLSVDGWGCASGQPVEGEEKVFLFDPQGELLKRLVPLAADRWMVAGCMKIEMASGGIPWTVEESIDKGNGKQATAATDVNPKTGHVSRVRIHVKFSDKWSAILHEMGHAFGIAAHAPGHGVFSNDPHHSEVIDEESLIEVCGRVDCKCFNPER